MEVKPGRPFILPASKWNKRTIVAKGVLFMKKTVAVLFGGNSTEYEVSLQSAGSVIENLDPEKYHILLLGITRQGKWMKYDGGVESIRQDTWWQHPSCVPVIFLPGWENHGILVQEEGKCKRIPVDVAFPVLHGKNGEDGTVQGLLKLMGIPCAGCGILSSALCMDKDMAHRLVRLAGVRTPDSIVLHSQVPDAELREQTAGLSYPVFVKPVHSGSSFGITRVSGADGLSDAVKEAFHHDGKVVIEEAIPGFEVGCAVLGTDPLTIGEVDEIELSRGFFDYTEKYTLKTSKIHMPARIDAGTAERVKQAAAVVYRTLGCSGFARVDFFLTPQKEIVFNEVNTIPGFTTHSRYPSMLKGIGITFEQMVDEMIRLAVES